jgi:hypothetical protein
MMTLSFKLTNTSINSNRSVILWEGCRRVQVRAVRARQIQRLRNVRKLRDRAGLLLALRAQTQRAAIVMTILLRPPVRPSAIRRKRLRRKIAMGHTAKVKTLRCGTRAEYVQHLRCFSFDVAFFVFLNGRQRRLATVANGDENTQYPLQYKEESGFYSLGTLFSLRFFLCQPPFCHQRNCCLSLKQTYG